MLNPLLLAEPYATVRVEASVPCVVVQWHGFANADDYIRAIEAGLRCLEQQATPARPWGWVGDTRRMSAIPSRALAWLIAEFTPRVLATGLRELSVVDADSVFGRQAHQRYVQETGQAGLLPPTTLYPTLEAALAGARAALAA